MDFKTLAVGLSFTATGLVLGISGCRNAYAAHHRFATLQPLRCVIVEKRVTQGVGKHTWGRHSSTPYEAWARVRYSFNGVAHVAAGDLFPANRTESGQPPSEVLGSMAVGSSQRAWIDPNDPQTVLLSRGYDTGASYLLMIVGGSVFALVGATCTVDSLVGIPWRLRKSRRCGRSTR